MEISIHSHSGDTAEGLKPCPFCGGNEIVKLKLYGCGSLPSVFYECKKCGACGSKANDVESAEKMWNERKGEENGNGRTL